jgi:hypothetical protein
LWVIGVVVIDGVVKLHTSKEHRRVQQLRKIDFDTKLGVMSPDAYHEPEQRRHTH